METDMAIQRSGEKWAAGESLYEQPDKVTFIYRSQKRGRGIPAARRHVVKPSRSYDNELEASACRDTEGRSATPRSSRIHDNLSLSFGSSIEQIPGARDGRHLQERHHFPVHAGSERTVLTGKRAEGGSESADRHSHKKTRWKQKPEFSDITSHTSGHKYPIDSQTDFWIEEIQGQEVMVVQDSKKRSIPIEFHLKEDQFQFTGPSMQYKRPINLSSHLSSSSPSSLSKEKPSSFVIVEVKDGPTFFYKPSDHMVSDSGFGHGAMMSSRDFVPHAPARQVISGITEPSFVDPPKTSPFSAYSGNFSFGKSENSTFSAFRRDSSTGLYHMDSVSVGASLPSLEDSPRVRSAASQLPRTPGLRKPDLSVLSTPHRKRAEFSSDSASSISKGSSEMEIQDKQEAVAKVQESVSTSLPITSTQTLPHPIDVLQPNVLQSSNSGIKCDSDRDTRNSHQSAVTGVDIYSSVPSQDFAMSVPLALDPSLVFQNTSEIVQQKAGIKHDDIIVGPRRPISGVTYQDASAGYPENAFPSAKYNTLGPVTAHLKPKINLSASTDGLSVGHPVLFLENESLRRRDIRSESDFSVAGMSTVDSKSEHHAPSSTLALKEEHYSKIDNQTGAHISSIEATSRAATCTRLTNETNIVEPGIDREKDKRTGERKTDIHQSQLGKISSSQTVDYTKTRISNLEVMPDATPSYKTKSLDRHHKSINDTKAVSKSANVSPAKHQTHSPKSKSSASTPSKKLPVSSKLHMLSNIPVPIGHDPPAKRLRPLSSPDSADTNVPLTFERNFVAGTSDSSRTNNVPEKELAKTSLMSSIPDSISDSPSQPSSEVSSGSAVSGIQNKSSANVDGLLTVENPPVGSVAPSLVEESKKLHANFENTTKEQHMITTTPKAEETNNIPSTATVDNAQTHTDLRIDSPCNVPVKPRLHRSTEHLIGDAKLTVFNSSENVPFFDKSEASNSRVFQDSTKPEKTGGDSISPLKKPIDLPKTGIMRRGSDRTEMYRRGSDRAFLPITNNDPSVEDLKKATSLKELCQSMASLLNIDNVKAAEMITTSLSQRQDLVEGLDADAILDYLSHHGVLDPGILVGLDDKASVAQRNSMILKHVEEHGNTAVALFINALRQSGQLHLASSLDTEQRIKPVSGNGYFGKDRHKGEITIRIEVEALKIVAPREPRNEKIVDTSLLGSPGRQTDDTGVTIRDAADEEDFVKPRSCWCFCFSYKSKIKALSKKDTEKQKKSQVQKQQRHHSSSPEKESRRSEDPGKKELTTKPHRSKSQEKAKRGKESFTKVVATESSKKELSKSKDKDNTKKSKSSKSKSKVSGKYSTTKTDGSTTDLKSVPEVAFPRCDGQQPAMGGSEISKLAGSRPNMLQHEPHIGQHQPYNGSNQTPKADKDAWDPIIMEYNPKLELIKLRAGQEELASPTRQSGNIGIMCEQWKSNGRHFQNKASQLCEKIVQELHTEIIKYFEQDRGTLVLDVTSDISSVLVVNICMMQAQVRSLQQEIDDDSLLDKMQDMFFSRVDIADFDIRGVKLRIVLDEPELNIVLSELS